MQLVHQDVVQECQIRFLRVSVSELVVRAGHRLRQEVHDALMQWAYELIQDVENVQLREEDERLLSQCIRVKKGRAPTCNRCMSNPMKFMKSTSSVGSKCASKLDIKVGIKSVTLDPVIATIRANANRVYYR